MKVETKNLEMSLGGASILKGIDIALKNQEFVGVLGPNGSGKSTLLKCLYRVLKPTGGTVFLDGQELHQYKPKESAKKVAVVAQHNHSFFDFSVGEVVMMGRSPHKKAMEQDNKEDYRIVKEALRTVQMEGCEKRSFSTLSGGEQQRVMVARALAQQTDCLILDEPTNHLDIQYTLEIMELMRKLNREQGITVFAVLHDINMAARFSDRMIVLSEGSKVKDGPVSEVLREDVLKPVYSIDLVVRENPLIQTPEILALRSSRTKRKDNGKKVHIICGGGSGSRLIETFYNRGWQVSCGVLSSGDSDYELCCSLGIQVIEEKPYTDISKEVYEKNLQAVSCADLVILADVDIGRNNLANVQVLKEAGGKKLYILREKARDYTGGAADAMIAELIESGRAAVADTDSMKKLFPLWNKV